jgi:hypothetical protein
MYIYDIHDLYDTYTHTHTHSNLYIHTYLYVYVYHHIIYIACVCVCVCVCACVKNQACIESRRLRSYCLRGEDDIYIYNIRYYSDMHHDNEVESGYPQSV